MCILKIILFRMSHFKPVSMKLFYLKIVDILFETEFRGRFQFSFEKIKILDVETMNVITQIQFKIRITTHFYRSTSKRCILLS